MHIADLFFWVVYLLSVFTVSFVTFNIGKKLGKEEFKELIFKNSLKQIQIMSLKKGFETY